MRGIFVRIWAAIKHAYCALESALVEAEQSREIDPDEPMELDLWDKGGWH